MRRFRPLWAALTAFILLLPAGCRESDPPPRFQQNLGTDDQPLPPTASTRQDRRLLDGQSDWHAFREPTVGETAARPAAPTPGVADDPELAADIRAALEEHNTKLASAAYAELADFYVSGQVELVPKLAATLASLSAKLSELGQHLPEARDGLDRLAERLSPATMLKLEAAGVKPGGANAAVATLAALPEMGFLPQTDPSQISRDVSLTLADDGYWYIESPVVAALGRVLPALEDSVSQLDGVIADAKGGGASVSIIAERLAPIQQMLDSLPSPDEGGAGSSGADRR